MNWNYVAHIIRDIFPQKIFTTLYGRNKELIDMVAKQIKNFLKPGGFAMIVNPGIWADDLGKHLTINAQVETEIKRYSTFSQQDVSVYENI